MDDINLAICNKEKKLYTKTQAACKMISAGVSPKDAAKIVNNKQVVNRNTVANLKKKYARYSLAQPKIVKLAYSQAERILRGEPREITQQAVNRQGEVVEYIEKIIPTDTNIISIVSEVYERIDPKKQDESKININADMMSMVLLAVRQPDVPVEQVADNQEIIDILSPSTVSGVVSD